MLLLTLRQSIRGFAHSSFKMALQKRLPLVSAHDLVRNSGH